MKYMIASDIHGSAYYCRKMLEAWDRSGAERLFLLGDILYHGPRNDLPKEYDPKQVISILNERKDKICAVRGNCDTEVDQMVLDFPIMADYGLICGGKFVIYATHGHVYNEENLPPMVNGDVLLHGHTHLLRADRIQTEDGCCIAILNPGSVSIPKGGNPHTYGILDKGIFRIMTLEDERIKEIDLQEDGVF